MLPFQILNLPHVAFRKVMSHLTLIELYCEKDESNHESEEKFREVLKTDIMWIGLPSKFKYTGPFANLDAFGSVCSTWMSLENLFSLGETVVRIDLVGNSNFTKEDINAFMKYWFNNNMKRFRMFRFKFENIGEADIYDGLEDHLLTVDQKMYLQCGLIVTSFEPNSTVLRRDDGMIAVNGQFENGFVIIGVHVLLAYMTISTVVARK
uniref:F-box domain-containing protein n=1 Tax=Caenorhabditis tropicalis TaxID=1561998 RepID=A0A1I7TF85_9PELO